MQYVNAPHIKYDKDILCAIWTLPYILRFNLSFLHSSLLIHSL